jgi:anti-sigma regulatory factor (Ser/Thr protein kinase)
MPQADGTTNRQYSFRLPAIKANVSASRDQVSYVLTSWGLKDSVTDTAVLLVSELTTNVVLHCRVTSAVFEVTVYEEDGNLWVGVADPDRRLPKRRVAGDDDVNGRGLTLLAAMAAEWSIEHRRPVGKVVWARIPTAESEMVSA